LSDQLKQRCDKLKTLLPPLIAAVCWLLYHWISSCGTLGKYYTSNVFRMGIIPRSDARGWSNGAFDIIRGLDLTEYPAFRPLTPLFYSEIFSLSGSEYFPAMIIQGGLLAVSIGVAAFLLRNVRNRGVIWLFFAFLCVWRPEIQTTFVSEVPGMIVLMPAFALLLRGVIEDKFKDRLCGVFLFGLFQAIRPWNIFSLALLPFIAFRRDRSFKAALREWTILCAAGIIGFGFHQGAAKVFNHPDAVSGNHPKALYGRVSGGLSWASYFLDPVIRKAREDKNLKPQELRRVVYDRIWEIFKKNPFGIIKSIWTGERDYVIYFPNAFGFRKWTFLWFAGFMLLFMLIEFRKRVFQWGLELVRDKSRFVFTLAGIAAGLFFFKFFMTAMFLVGTYCLIREYKSRLSWFCLLYFAGIILSLPLVGNDGIDRIKIGSDILLFFIAAAGIVRIYGKWFEESREELSWRFVEFKPALSALSAAIVLFFIVPGIIKAMAPVAKPVVFPNKAQLQKIFSSRKPMLDSYDLECIWNRFPEPSFELFNGRTAYLTVRYQKRDAIFESAGKGMTHAADISQYWPFGSLDVDRTILTLHGRQAILPGIKPEQLRAFEGHEILLLGELITRPRRYFYATAYVLYVTHIGWIDRSGRLAIMVLDRK